MQRRALIVSITLWVASLASSAAGQELRVDYTGELIDGTGRPLAGVFDLEFKLFETDQSEAPIWTERHYLAVGDGEYTVQLGSDTPLAPELMGQELILAADFMGQEVLRETLLLQATQPGEETQDILAELGDLTQVTFAQLADRAISADTAMRAEDCDTLGGRTADDLDRYDELMGRLEELEERLAGQAGGGGVQIGSSTTVLQRIGGEGGNRYTRMCPAGYVVVGVRGGSGGFIDSMEFVCAPLE